eukprot:2448598-Karenia_brevis.AAC.1
MLSLDAAIPATASFRHQVQQQVQKQDLDILLGAPGVEAPEMQGDQLSVGHLSVRKEPAVEKGVSYLGVVGYLGKAEDLEIP